MLFLSYSREDRSTALRLTSELGECGLYVHRDPPLFVANAFWRDEILKKLVNSKVLIVLWSRCSCASPWVNQEIRAYSGPILVILLDATPWSYWHSNHEPCVVVAESETIPALRGLLRDSQSYYPVPNTQVERGVEEDDLLKIRLKNLYHAMANQRSISTCIQRCTRFSPIKDSIVVNEWDGTILKRVTIDNSKTVYVAIEPVTNRQYKAFIAECGFLAPPTWTRVD